MCVLFVATVCRLLCSPALPQPSLSLPLRVLQFFFSSFVVVASFLCLSLFFFVILVVIFSLAICGLVGVLIFND